MLQTHGKTQIFKGPWHSDPSWTFLSAQTSPKSCASFPQLLVPTFPKELQMTNLRWTFSKARKGGHTLETKLARYAANFFRYSFLAVSVRCLYAWMEEGNNKAQSVACQDSEAISQIQCWDATWSSEWLWMRMTHESSRCGWVLVKWGCRNP